LKKSFYYRLLPYFMPKKKENSIYDKYREILRKPSLSDEEIDRIRKNVRLIAFALVEYVLKRKVNEIY